MENRQLNICGFQKPKQHADSLSQNKNRQTSYLGTFKYEIWY